MTWKEFLQDPTPGPALDRDFAANATAVAVCYVSVVSAVVWIPVLFILVAAFNLGD